MRLLHFYLVVVIGFSSISVFAVDLSVFQLTELQKKLILSWEEEDRFDEPTLLKFAKNFHDYNTRPPVYIPPHNPEELQQVIEWADGRAFAFFAKFTIYKFDSERYENDCPNLALFNFGLATATTYLKRDVFETSFHTLNLLAYLRNQSPEKFSQVYFELAKQKGFDSYLSTTAPVASIASSDAY